MGGDRDKNLNVKHSINGKRSVREHSSGKVLCLQL